MARKTSSGRNAAGAGSIRKKIVYRGGKKYEYWEGRITVGFDPGTGKQIQKSFTGKTQKEVLEKMQQAAAKIREMDYQEPSKMTVGDWLDVWIAEYLGNTKPHTKKSYTGIVDNHIRPAIGAVKLTSLTPIQVQKLINGIRSTKNTSAGQEVNPKTIKNVHGVLHSALAQAVRCGYLKSNPADLAVLPKRTKADIQVLDSTQISKFFTAIEGHRFEYLYQLDLFTGMRQSELLGLQWQDIDFDLKTITVRRQLQYLGHAHGGYQYTTPKSNKSRIIVLPDRAVEALLCQKEKQAQMAQLLGESWGNQDHLVFTDELGEHLKHDVVYRNLKRVFAGMGVPKLRFHDLRHSYAVLSLQSGCDIKTVQENLGHYAAAFTLDTYAHVTEQMRRDGAEKINRFLEKIDPKSPSGDQ